MIVKLMGGLGNQMFQYAMYKKLLLMNYSVLIDDRSLIKHGNEHNGLELKHVFNISYASIGLKEELKCFFGDISDKINRKIFKKTQGLFYLFDDLKTPIEEIINGGHQYLNGYWQNADYFNDIRDELLKDFQFVLRGDKTKDMIDKMKNEVSVSIHVRRGDYVQAPNDKIYGNICTEEYYHQAIKYMKGKIPNCFFYIFSDDPEWVQSHLKGEMDYLMIDWNRKDNSYLDMLLMANCKHNIIANSTFSWWGAWLNQNPDKIVICPENWYNNSDANPVLKQWVKIGNGNVYKE